MPTKCFSCAPNTDERAEGAGERANNLLLLHANKLLRLHANKLLRLHANKLLRLRWLRSRGAPTTSFFCAHFARSPASAEKS